MITKLQQAQIRQSKRLTLPLDQDLLLDISTPMISEWAHVMENHQVKFILNNKSSEMLRPKRQFSQALTSKLLLVWLTQLLLKRTLLQFSMK